LEGLDNLKKSTPSGLETATSRLVAYCFNQLHYRVPPVFVYLLEYTADLNTGVYQNIIYTYMGVKLDLLSLKEKIGLRKFDIKRPGE
jgi:hypothetical protein